MCFICLQPAQIMLKKIHLSMDYGLILTWSVSISEFTCDAVIVYKASNANESLLNNSPVSLVAAATSFVLIERNITTTVIQ